MKKLICVTAAVMLLSLPVLANTTMVNPSSKVQTEESTSTKSSTKTLPSGEKVHQDTTTRDSTKIEAQEDTPVLDSSKSSPATHMNRKSGATTEPVDTIED